MGKVFNKGLHDKDDQKEGLLKRLKNIEKNQNSNNNDKSKPSSARNESSKKTSVSDDKLEGSIYFPNVANMKDINNLELKNETHTSFEYLKNNTEEFFLVHPDIFDSDLKEFFKVIASEEKENIDNKLLLRQTSTRLESLLVFCKSMVICIIFGLLCLRINNIKLQRTDNVKLLQVRFLNDLMNGFEVYKKFKKSKKILDYKAEDLYLFLLANQNRTVNNIFLNTPTDKHNKEIYLQAKKLFNLREKILKNCLIREP